MPLYNNSDKIEITGTIQEANTGSTVLYGANTVFSEECKAGYSFLIDDEIYEISKIFSDTELTLENALEKPVTSGSVVRYLTITGVNFMDEDNIFMIDDDKSNFESYRQKGIRNKGWTVYKEYVTSNGTVRRKAETLVAFTTVKETVTGDEDYSDVELPYDAPDGYIWRFMSANSSVYYTDEQGNPYLILEEL